MLDQIFLAPANLPGGLITFEIGTKWVQKNAPVLGAFINGLSPVKWCNKSGQRSAAVPSFHVWERRDGPLLMLVREQCAQEPEHSRPVWEDADHVRTPAQLAVLPLERPHERQ